MRATETMTLSLPPEMAKQMARVQRREKRTPAELLREAWRIYFETHYPVYTPTKAEAAAIRKGRAEFERGEYVTLERVHHDLATARQLKRSKTTRKTA